MDLFAALAQLAAFVLLALALPVPTLRKTAVLALGAAAAAGFLHAVLGPEVRTLVTAHHYAGYEGSNQETSMVAFPTGTVTAPAWQWPLPFLAFALAWIAVLRALGERLPARPLATSLLLAWTATAAWLGMQHLAAPSPVVQPVGLDRALFPAGVALALLAARSAPSLLALVFTISLGTVLARLPAAGWSKLASDRQLGGCLDVSSVRDIVNPMTQMQFDPPLVPGSGHQQFWLIWLEHAIVFPALYLLSLFGIAFGAYMVNRHGGGDPAEAAR